MTQLSPELGRVSAPPSTAPLTFISVVKHKPWKIFARVGAMLRRIPD